MAYLISRMWALFFVPIWGLVAVVEAAGGNQDLVISNTVNKAMLIVDSAAPIAL